MTLILQFSISWNGAFYNFKVRSKHLSFTFLQMPVYTIASNAGVEGSVIVGKLLEQDDPDLGYDAAKGLWFTTNELETDRQMALVFEFDDYKSTYYFLCSFQVNMWT